MISDLVIALSCTASSGGCSYLLGGIVVVSILDHALVKAAIEVIVIAVRFPRKIAGKVGLVAQAHQHHEHNYYFVGT